MKSARYRISLTSVRHNALFLLIVILSVAILLSCTNAKPIVKSLVNKKDNSTTETPAPVTLEAKETSAGVYSSQLKGGTPYAQTVNAAISSAKNASVTFPPGSLALDTALSIEEGASLSSSQMLQSDLGLNESVKAEAEGTAIVISATDVSKTLIPMTITLDIPEVTGLRLQSYGSLVVLYRVIIDGVTFSGLLPREFLNIENRYVQFQFSYFGVFQTILLTEAVPNKIEIKTNKPIVTKKDENKATETATETKTDTATQIDTGTEAQTGTGTSTGTEVTYSISVDPPTTGYAYINQSNQSAYLVKGSCAPDGIKILFDALSPQFGTCNSGRFEKVLDVTSISEGSAKIKAIIEGQGIYGEITLPKDTIAPTAPAITGVTPTNNKTPTWAWTTDGSGNGTFRYRLNDSNLSDEAATETTSPNFTPATDLSDGDYTLYVQEKDTLGNWSATAYKSIHIETSSPTVTIASSDVSSGAYTNSNVINFSVTFSENVLEFSQPDISTTSGIISNFSSIDARNYIFKITLSSNSSNTVSIASNVATDAANNGNSASSPYTYTYDGTAPSVSIYTPPDPIKPSNSASFNLSGSCTSGDESVTVSVGSVSGPTSCSSNSWTINLNLSGLAEGVQYTASASQTDSANNTGTSSNINISKIKTVSVESKYSAAPNWMDYVRTDENTPCDGTETSYTACIHGGEKKKVVVTGKTSCANLALSDNLGAFSWFCNAESGAATFYSIGLGSGKHLSNLLGTSSWLDNYVSVTENGSLFAESIENEWWSNSIATLPDSSTSEVELSSSGTIYTFNSNVTTKGFYLSANKVGIVGVGVSAKLNGNSSTSTNCTAYETGAACAIRSDKNFLWIETTIDNLETSPSAGNRGITLDDSRWVRIDNTLIRKWGKGIVLGWTKFSKVTDSAFILNTDSGIRIEGNSTDDYNILRRVRSANNAGNGIHIYNSYANLIQSFTSASNESSSGDGIYVLYSNKNIFSNVLSANNLSSGLTLSSSNNNVFSASTFTSNASTNYGINISNSSNNLFLSTASLNNAGHGIAVSGGSGNISYNIALGQNAGYQSNVNTGLNYSGIGLFDITGIADCIQISSNLDSSCVGSGGFTTTTGYNFSSIPYPFAEKVGTSTPKSTLDVGFSFLNTSNLFSAWGKDYAVQINSGSRGTCSSGSCSQWDWRLPSNSPLKGVLSDMTNGAACPLPLADTEYFIYQSSPTSKFFKNALEILDDGVGNDDGLCESGEHCYYTRNIGAFQGEGLLSKECSQTGYTNIPNVTMHGY